MEIVLTGANGLVGREVLTYLKRHYPHIPLTAFVRKEPIRRIDGVRYVKGDLENNIPPELFRGDHIVLLHFASLLKGANLEEYRITNVKGTRELLSRGGSKIKKILYGSSMSAYGQGPFVGVKETGANKPETELAISRLEAEEVIRTFSKTQDISFLNLRPRFLFGTGDKETLPALSKLHKKGLIIGSGTQKFSFIGVEDYAAIIAKLATENHSYSGTLNIAYNEPISLKEIFEEFGTGKSYKSIPANLIMSLGKILPPLKKLRIKMQLIGQDQILNTEKLNELVAETKSYDGKKKFKTIVKDWKEGL